MSNPEFPMSPEEEQQIVSDVLAGYPSDPYHNSPHPDPLAPRIPEQPTPLTPGDDVRRETEGGEQ